METFSPQVNAFKTNGRLILFTLEVWEDWQLQSRRPGLNPAGWGSYPVLRSGTLRKVGR
jgi:hypothetical protein